MAVMANTAVVKDGTGTYTYDYSTASTQVYGGTAGVKQIDTSPSVRWGMVAADANADNAVYGNDYLAFFVPTFNITSQYRPADFNMDKDVFGNDYLAFYVLNFNSFNPLP